MKDYCDYYILEEFLRQCLLPSGYNFNYRASLIEYYVEFVQCEKQFVSIRFEKLPLLLTGSIITMTLTRELIYSWNLDDVSIPLETRPSMQ